MKFSDIAWNAIRSSYLKITEHPFNQELIDGTLDKAPFAYYIEQDSIYLETFARCQALLAAKIDSAHFISFLDEARITFITERELVHDHFKQVYAIQESGKLTPATLGYTSYLLQTVLLEPTEVGLAALLSCPWIYCELGQLAMTKSLESNPYQAWIDSYATQEFQDTTQEKLFLINKLHRKASSDTQAKMLTAFLNATYWEWHFWNDAYYGIQLDRLSHSMTASSTLKM